MQDKDIDRFRGWALMALYVSMSVLGVMLVVVALRFWPALEDKENLVFVLSACGAATAVLSARTALQFFRTLRQGGRPKMEFLPFILMGLTLFATSNLMAEF